MRNLIIFLFHLLCFATANHALAQQKVLVSDYFFKEDSAYVQNKLLNIQEYRLDADIFLYQRLNTLLQLCNDKLAPNCANGFAIYFRTQMNGPLQLFISPVTSAHDLDNPKLMGVFFDRSNTIFYFQFARRKSAFHSNCSDHFLTAHHQYKRTVRNYFEYALRIRCSFRRKNLVPGF